MGSFGASPDASRESEFVGSRNERLGRNELSAVQSATNKRERRGMLLRAVSGVSFEYYDYVASGAFAPFSGDQFFEKSESVVAILNTLLVFGPGFMMRPIGAMAAGGVADRFGRKPVMMAVWM
jgi:hypothetical protein